MTDKTKYSNISVSKETYSSLKKLSKELLPGGTPLSISKTVDVLVNEKIQKDYNLLKLSKQQMSEEEALKISNDVEYGLTGYIWTNNVTRALRFSDELEAGMIWVNSENVRHLPTPFGGIKSSGIGRDGGDWSFEFYMEQKHIGFATGNHQIPKLGK